MECLKYIVCILLLFAITQPVAAQQASIPLAIDTIYYRPDQQALELRISYINSQFQQQLDESNLRLYEVSDLGEEVQIFNFSRQKESTTAQHIFLIHGYDFQSSQHEALYRGEIRKIRAELETGSQIAEQAFVVGSPTNPVNLGFVDWQLLALVGGLIVAGLLAIFSQLFPGIRQLQFVQKFVKRYKDIDKKQYARNDPYTLQAFEEQDRVVIKCRQIHHYDTWKLMDNKCVNYPACLRHTPGVAKMCHDGEGIVPGEVFFHQQGTYRALNWIWFGALGGLMAWLLMTAFSALSMQPLYDFFGKISGDGNGYALLRDSLTGFSLGLFLSFMLAWAEENGQSRQFSWGRIALRTALGAGVASTVFFISFLLFRTLFGENVAFLRGLLTWVLFGGMLGISLSVRSSIHILRGLIGGSLAGAIAFVLYDLPFLMNAYSWGRNSFEWTKMIAFILLGAILAYTLVSVIRSYEDFELTYLSPAEFRRVNPISKWLKTGMNIYMGTDSSSYVFIKWSDLDPSVQPQHAELSYQNGKVFIKPLHPVWLNGREIPLNKAYELRDKDEIQLGAEGVTRMLFQVKKEVSKTPEASRQNAPVAAIKIQKRN